MVLFGQRLTRSAGFKALFDEGMALVEEAATYLDGPGRDEARALGPHLATAYSAESMRLTTRLMQVASWLLIRRAIVDGETMPAEDGPGKRFRLSAQGIVSSPGTFAELPPVLRGLADRSLRLQARVLWLDEMVSAEAPVAPAENGPSKQFARLQAAYAAR